MQQGDSATAELSYPTDSADIDSTPEAAEADSDAMSADDSTSSSESAHLLGFKENVKNAAKKAADSTSDFKGSVAKKFRGFESSHVDSADVAEAHTSAVTSDPVGGKVLLPLSAESLPMSFRHNFPCLLPLPLLNPLPHSASDHSDYHLVQHTRTVVSTAP